MHAHRAVDDCPQGVASMLFNRRVVHFHETVFDVKSLKNKPFPSVFVSSV